VEDAGTVARIPGKVIEILDNRAARHETVLHSARTIFTRDPLQRHRPIVFHHRVTENTEEGLAEDLACTDVPFITQMGTIRQFKFLFSVFFMSPW
jgi:hypothetical protein